MVQDDGLWCWTTPTEKEDPNSNRTPNEGKCEHEAQMMIPRRNKVKVTAEMGSAGENIQKQSNSDISVSGSSN